MTGRGWSSLGLALAIGCAPIDVDSQVSVHPREATPEVWGLEQLDRRDYAVEYVQLGARLLVSVREHRSCVGVRHIPVMRVEDIHRTNRGFVAWDFGLGIFTGGFAALAFARPQLFSPRLIDNQGRVVYEKTPGYVIGGVFAVISAGLLAAGIVDGLRSRDSVRYAAAFEVELGAPGPCRGGEPEGLTVAERSLTLRIDMGGDGEGDAGEGELVELDAATDEHGRARFELPAWTGPIPADGQVSAVLVIAERGQLAGQAQLLAFGLRVPFDGAAEAHTGVADTRAVKPVGDANSNANASPSPSPNASPNASPTPTPEPGAIEGPGLR